MNSEDCMGHSNPIRLPFFFLIPSLEKGNIIITDKLNFY